MAQNLGIKTVAEGVETKEQVAFLRDLGCDIVQGYYFAKPMAAEGLTQILKAETEI
ncbi:MAG: EAL domain-containing protein [Angelakisella sp.]